MKSPKNQNKMLYISAKKSGSRDELKNIKKLKDKASSKRYNSISDSSSNYSESSISSHSDWDKDRQLAGRMEINMLDHVMTDDKSTNKDQHNDAIDNEPTFDNNSFNLYRETKDPLPVVTFSLRGGKKHIPITVSGITCLWGSGATNIMIKIIHIKYYERNIWYNKL